MTAARDEVITALRDLDAAAAWPAARCSRLFMQARLAGLLGRVAGGPQAWPPAAQGHVESARRVARAQHDEIRREVGFIAQALGDTGVPVVLLKGAAYVMAGLPAAEGRTFSDIDILVPKAALPLVESQLMLSGWMSTVDNAYDERYYRQWMHELPPMQHARRQTTLDVHHTILPETARLHPDPRLLLESALPLPGSEQVHVHVHVHVLCPPDMVLHSMTHLFMNDDMSHALRDLSDLDLLLRHFGRADGFWPLLLERAARLGLQRPLFYGLRYTARLLGTPVPASASAAADPAGPALPLRLLMDAIWLRALHSPHIDAAPPGRAAALAALYLRGHWLRMPPLLLARHLTIKALRRREHTPAAPGGAG